MKWCYALVILTGFLTIGVLADENDFDDDAVVSTDSDSETSETQQEAISYQSPYAEPGKFHFAEHFDNLETFDKKWIKSEAKKDDASEDIAKYDGVWTVEAPQRQILRGDLGLVLKSKAKHAAISSRLIKPFVFTDKPLVVQYEVTLQDGQECGGAYIKLLSSGKETTDLKQFHDKTPYSIMFGPDKCGNDIKLHFIFRHVNPINGTISEKHCKKPKERLEEPFKDKEPHLYQLVINPDNTFTVSVDHKVVNEGSLLSDFNPAVNPPREIDDPEDKKPENWDEREKIPDPDAKKPEDWDEDAPPQIPDENSAKPDGWLDHEEEMIPDPNAEKPADWDTDMDGEWEAPLIPNPACEKAVGCGQWNAPLISNPNYKGKWRAPLLDNPNYQGKWAPRKILNPDFFEDLNPFKMTPISAVGIELWSMSSDILFDNFVITDDVAVANAWADQTYNLKRKQIDKDAETFLTRLTTFTNENPWMWAVYVIVVGIPLALIVFFMSNKEKLHTKKTDAYLPDDEPSGHGDEQGDGKREKSVSPKPKKSDLDEPTPEDDENDDDGGGEGEETGEEEEGINDNQEEDDVENVEEVQNETDTNKPETSSGSDSARKRKPRRE